MKRDDILELMDLMGWDLAQLATGIGVNFSTAWRWLEDGSTPSPLSQSVLRALLVAARQKPHAKQRSA